MNIKGFEEGDMIVRVLPMGSDKSYVGEPMIFLGNYNGRIYLGRNYTPEEPEKTTFLEIVEHGFSEGWDYYDIQNIDRVTRLVKKIKKGKFVPNFYEKVS